jgi:polar amino acid transport system substrate-binding protein
MFKLVYLLSCLLYCCFANTSIAAATEQVVFKYCYENKEFLPHFTGNSTEIPAQYPGAEIEILRALDQQITQIRFQFQREPWLRCLKYLETGQVDAVIGSYNKQRAQYAMYPWKDNQLDLERAYLRIDTCLLTVKGAKLDWDGRQFTVAEKIAIAVPRGYSIIKLLSKQKFVLYETDSPEKAHELLFKRRVQASISSCDFEQFPDYIVKQPIPIRSHYGYLMISRPFFQQHPELTEQLWDGLAAIDKQSYYQKY